MSRAGAREAIRVPGIRFEGKHGWHARERESARPFRVDLYVEADLSRATETDQLPDTVDYRVLAQRVVTLGTERSFKLIEALGAAIADDLLAHVTALSLVQVSVFKPVTLSGDVTEVEAIVVRERGGS